MTRKTETVEAKDVSEIDNIPFQFSASLEVGETINSAVVTSEVHSGTDASPGAELSGSPTVVGTTVVQKVTGGLAGTSYLLRCVAT